MARILFGIKALHQVAGGAERVLATVASELARRGHQVAVASFDPVDAPPFYPLDPAVERIPLAIGRTGTSSTVGETVRRIAALRHLAKDRDWDVAVGFMHSTFIPLGIALVGTGIPMIASEHISYAHYRQRHVERWLLELTPRLSFATTVLSDAVRMTFPRRLRRGMVPVTNPVSPPAAAHVRSGRREVAAPVVLAVGRLAAQKDYGLLLQVFARLADRHPAWRLRIVGDGELRHDLTQQADALGIADRVAMPGVVREIGSEYSAADIFVMPSLYESFGLATAEALAHGVPSVGFADDPGSSLLIKPDVNGVLADGPDRATALELALDRLMGDTPLRLRLGEAAPRSIAPFMSDAVIGTWEALIAQAVQKSDRQSLDFGRPSA